MEENVYTENFIVAVYNNEFKIVSIRTILDYKAEVLSWGYDPRSVEKADGMTVLDNGELVDVLRLREPDDEFWIKDYLSKSESGIGYIKLKKYFSEEKNPQLHKAVLKLEDLKININSKK